MDGLGRAATNSLGEKEGSGTAHLVAGIHHMVCCLRKHIPALILMWDFNLSPGREIQLCRRTRTTIFRSGYETKQSSSITGAGAHSMDKPITGIRTRGSLG